VMGINSASYLILPKIIAAVLTFPLLVIIAAFLSMYGGFLAGVLTEVLTEKEYIYGIRYQFSSYNVGFAIIKSLVFAFLISSISSYQGYFTKGGALEVGKSSTEAVTNSCIAVLCADYLLAQLLLK
jgi:phospholipid/cholesterol/gamma-HCH transport system permease protein